MAGGARLGTYYVVMCDYGRRGREAIVDPELTRGAIVARIATHDFAHDRVLAIHRVALGEPTIDVTDDILTEAGRYDTALQPDADTPRDDPHYDARMRRLAGVA